MKHQTLVSLDLETTGLDSDRDRIIEVGAVKFRGPEVLETFHSLVKPGRPLSRYISYLTGIGEHELAGAPPFEEIAPGLVSFLAGHPLVGQNIAFDLDFLSSHGLKVALPAYDILEACQTVLPDLPEYGLGPVAERLGVSSQRAHRALDDAVAAKGVFLKLVDLIGAMDADILREVLRLTAGSAWPWCSYFEQAAALAGNNSGVRSRFRVPVAANDRHGALPGGGARREIDVTELTHLLDEGGPLSRALPSYSRRPGQVAVMQAVARAFNGSHCLLAEAGTGTGKSVAYLLPAIRFAIENNTRVVVSTNTINLQEQLMSKDLPDLVSVLGLEGELKVAQLKGRGNYLCLRQWDAWRESGQLAWDEVLFLLRILVWACRTRLGDSAELNIRRDTLPLWNRVSASQQNCQPEGCPYREAGCFLHRARKTAEAAHLVVINHALLLSDLANNAKTVPEYRHLVIDEAHHLEEEATEQLGYGVSLPELLQCLARCGEKSGLAQGVKHLLQGRDPGSGRCADLAEVVARLTEGARSAERAGVQFFRIVGEACGAGHGEQGEFEERVPIKAETRQRPAWRRVSGAWGELLLSLTNLESSLDRLYISLADLDDASSAESLQVSALALLQALADLRRRINTIIEGGEANQVDWVVLGRQGDVRLCAAPLSVGEVLGDMLFRAKDSVVLTSATLSMMGSFVYARECLGLNEAEELVAESPFDYVNSTLLYLPNDMPEPGRPSYQQTADRALAQLCRASRGRMLVLFTSHAALRASHAALQAALAGEDILVLGQGVDGSPRQLVAFLKAHPNSVLLGTSSLWEGIDIVGDALSVLVIARLPFTVPSDPVFAARSALFDNPFNQYALPQAVLKLRQGFGRLIRSKDDRGAVILLDSRLNTKSYGRAFLSSLPLCTMRKGTLEQMPQTVSWWLGR